MEYNDFIIRISVHKETKLGETIFLVGDSPILGNWELEQGVRLRWEEGNIWKTRIRTSYLKTLEYKYVLVKEQEDQAPEALWEVLPNRQVKLDPKARVTIAVIGDEWEKPEDSRLIFSPKVITDIPAIVVLGKILLPDGSASQTLVTRIITASEVFLREREKNLKSVMIVAGGKVHQNETHNKIPSEAEVMRILAVQNFVPKSSVVMETKSMNTIENALNVRDILEDLGVTKVILITSDYHMQRAKRIFDVVLTERGKVKEYSISCVEDKPPISPEERKRENEVEQKMLPLLETHLALYMPR